MDDQQHLRLLSIFHYVVGGFTALMMCLPLIHLGLGIAMVFFPESFQSKPSGETSSQFIGWLFIIMGGLFFLAGQALAICMIASGRFLAQRKRHLFIFVIACIECTFMPFGTILGVFTIIVLSRESVKRLFGAQNSPA